MATRIRARRAVVDSAGNPPSFTIRTGLPFCEVEVTIDPLLFSPVLANRRKKENYYISPGLFVGKSGVRNYTLDKEAWSLLNRYPYLYYRAVAYDAWLLVQRKKVEASLKDNEPQNAPSVYVVPSGIRPPPLKRRVSGKLKWLRVSGNQIVNEDDDPVVLRGVNRSGMEYTDRRALDPTGVSRPTSREAAGITHKDIREIASYWKANIIRLPINQEWALTRADYLANIDRIIEWAAAEGAYVLISLHWFDTRREFGHTSDGSTNHVPPMPEENSVRLWSMLASRYRQEPAVLYDVFNEPHVPLADDQSYSFKPPVTEAEWLHMWHSWVRRIAAAIHRESSRALIFVSGWDWALNLRSFPVPLGGGQNLANAVYSAHVYYFNTPGRSTATLADFDFWFGFTRLRSGHPIFVGEWGGESGNLAWGKLLEQYLRNLHRYKNGMWQGLAGWSAWSWADKPLLVERGQGSRVTAGGGTVKWRTYVMNGSHNKPTEFGELVRWALLTMPLASSVNFDIARPVGSRSRYLVTTSPARHGDPFVVYGHDFTRGTKIIFRSGAAVVIEIAPRTVLPHMLIVPTLSAVVPAGNATCEVERPDGLRSERVNLAVSAAPTADAQITPGAGKANDYTILFLANPAVETAAGAFLADPIQARKGDFYNTVADTMTALFGMAESYVHLYANEIRVIARFAPDTVVQANALCRQIAGGMMEPMQDRINAYLAAKGLKADVCLALYNSPTHVRCTAWWTVDNNGSPGKVFVYDGANHNHRQRATKPGVVALLAPVPDLMTPLHEFLHAASDANNGQCGDLYVDTAAAGFKINQKRRGAAGGSVPAHFATYNDVDHKSDRTRDSIGYPASWRSYHPQLINRIRPNVMDNYYLTPRPLRCRLDHLTLRFMRDRIEWKLGR